MMLGNMDKFIFQIEKTPNNFIPLPLPSPMHTKEYLKIMDEKKSGAFVANFYGELRAQCGSASLHIEIDQHLSIRMADISSTIYCFKASCMIYPFYAGKKVQSVQIINEYDTLTLAGRSQDVQKLYLKLSRVFPHKGFNDFWKPIKRLGRGSFATVYLVEHKQTGIRKAAKVFSKQGQKIEFKGKQALENEIKTLKEVDHPNLIRYDGLYYTDSLIYLVTEYLSGGTLEDTLRKRANLTGELVQHVIKCILSGLAYLDSIHIMHRDIKPENVILREEDDQWVIGDFGLAAKSNEEYIYDKCGTMGYIAPEIMTIDENEKYAQACDIYSLGIIAYQLIIGELPFKVESQNLFDKKMVWVMFQAEECRDIGSEVRDFLGRLLEKDPKKRITARQALSHPFFEDQKVVSELIAYHVRKIEKRHERILKMANCN